MKNNNKKEMVPLSMSIHRVLGYFWLINSNDFFSSLGKKVVITCYIDVIGISILNIKIFTDLYLRFYLENNSAHVYSVTLVVFDSL